MGPRASQDLRSPSLIMAPGFMSRTAVTSKFKCAGFQTKDAIDIIELESCKQI